MRRVFSIKVVEPMKPLVQKEGVLDPDGTNLKNKDIRIKKGIVTARTRKLLTEQPTSRQTEGVVRLLLPERKCLP